MAESEPALESVVSGKYAVIDMWGRVTAADKKEGMTLLGQIECRHLADRPWTFLSQGERQRVLIGRALMARPKVLILDEPCAGLDPVAREHFLQWLERMGRGKESPALVLVTHHVEEIMPAFTHGLILRRGRVLAAGPRGRVLTSSTLSEAFDTGVQLRRLKSRLTMRVEPSNRSVV
jgi:iron complex transport system ATP-binding protein